MVQRCWVNFQCRGVLLIWLLVGQGPIALAIGAGGGCLGIFTLIYPFSPLSPSLWETARYRLKYCLKGPLNPNQPTNQLTEKLEFQNELALWESCKKLGSPVVCYPSIQVHPTGSGMYAVSNLHVTNVKRVLSFHSPSGEDRGGAVNLKLIFGVVTNLDPLVSWKLHWGRDLVIQVDEMLTLWGWVRDQVVHCGYTLCITTSKWGMAVGIPFISQTSK